MRTRTGQVKEVITCLMQTTYLVSSLGGEGVVVCVGGGEAGGGWEVSSRNTRPGGATRRPSKRFSMVISTDRVIRRSSTMSCIGKRGNSCCTWRAMASSCDVCTGAASPGPTLCGCVTSTEKLGNHGT